MLMLTSVVAGVAAVGGTAGAASSNTLVVDDDGTGDHLTISAALANASAGDTIEVRDGTYVISNRLDIPHDGITIEGESQAGVVIDASGHDGWAIYASDKDGLTLRNLTVQGNAADRSADDSIKVAFGEDIVIENVTVKGSAGNEIDLNNVRDATLRNVVVDGEGTGGVGLALSGVQNATLDNFDTSNNAWGGVGLFDVNPAVTAPSGWTLIQNTGDVTVESDSDLSEMVSLYSDQEFGGTLGDLYAPDYGFAVENPDFRTRGDDFVFYHETKSVAVGHALALANNSSSTVRTLAKDSQGEIDLGSTFIVADDMSIQAAIDAAGEGATIDVSPGTYVGSLDIDVANLTLSGPNAGVPAYSAHRSSEATVDANGSELAIHIQEQSGNVTVDGFAVKGWTQVGIVQGMSDSEGTSAHVLNNDVDVSGQPVAHGNSIQVTGDDSTVVGNDVEVTGYDYDETDWATSGILAEGVNNTEIVDNHVTYVDTGDVGKYHRGITVEGAPSFDGPANDNVVRNNTVVGLSTAISIQMDASNTVIEYNTIADSDVGLAVRKYQTRGENKLVDDIAPTGVTVEGNSFDGNDVQVNDPVDTLDLDGVLDTNDFDRAVTIDRPENSLLPTIWSSIQHGVDNASAGDTIDVQTGTYNEQVWVNESVELVAPDGAIITYQPDGQSGLPTVTVTENNTTVRGFTVKRVAGPDRGTKSWIPFTQGIRVSASNITVENNTVTGENLVHGHNAGIMVLDDESGNPTGETVTNVSVSDNDVSGFATPFSAFVAYGGTIDDVTFEANQASGNDFDAVLVSGADVTAPDYDVVLANSTGDFYFSSESGALAASSQIEATTIQNTTSGEFLVAEGMSIQAAVDAADSGDTITVGSGTFNESGITIAKPVTIAGAGMDNTVIDAQNSTTSGNQHVFVIQSNHTTIRDLTMTDGHDALRISENAHVEDFALVNTRVNDSNIGIYVAGNDVDSGNGEFDDVLFQNTRWIDNRRKAIYVEKLSNATFDGLVIDGVTGPDYGFINGIDINLKGGNYKNVIIRDSVVRNVAKGNPHNGISSFSSAIAIKGRDDSSYSTNPGYLNGLTIENVTVVDSFNGLRLGEPGKSVSTPKNVVITDSTFRNNTGFHFQDVTGTPLSAGPVVQNNDFDSGAYVESGTQVSMDLQSIVDEAVPGDTVHVGPGTYDTGKLSISKTVTIDGSDDGTTTLDTTGSSSYGVHVTASGVALRDLDVIGPNDPSSGFGIKVSGTSAPEPINVTIEDVSVSNSSRTEIDLNNVRGAVLRDVVADGNGTAGVGVALSATQDVLLDNVTTTGNTWGGVGLFDYDPNAGHQQNTSNVTVTSTSDLGEQVPLYSDQEYGGTLGDLFAPDYAYAVENPDHRESSDGRGEDFVYFRQSKSDAVAFALALENPGSSIVRTLAKDPQGEIDLGSTFVVDSGMSIQAAIDAADPGDTILVEPGVHEEALQISTNDLTVVGSDANDRPVIDGVDKTGDGIRILGADDVTIENLVVTRFEDGVNLRYTAGPVENLTIRNVDAVDNSRYGFYGLSGPTHKNLVFEDVNASANNDDFVGRGVFLMSATDGVTVANSTFDHNGLVGLDFSFTPNDNSANANVTITNVSTAGNGDVGVAIHNTSDAVLADSTIGDGLDLNGIQGLYVSGNSFEGDDDFAIRYRWVYDSPVPADNLIANNEFVDVAGDGIYVGEHSTGTPASAFLQVAGNDFSGVTGYAVNNTIDETGFVVNATRNYWGAPSGPGGAGPGDGANVTENVTFRPYYPVATLTELSSQPPQFAGVTLTDLADGNGVVGDGDRVRVSATVVDASGVHNVTVDARLLGGSRKVTLTKSTSTGNTYTGTFTVDAATATAPDGVVHLPVVAFDTGNHASATSSGPITLSTQSTTTTTFTLSDATPLNVDVVDVDVTVDNVGAREADRTITLLVDGSSVASRAVTVAAGDSETVTFQRRFSTGQHAVTVTDGNVTLAPKTITVSRATNPAADVTITAPNAGEAFDTGDVTVTYDLTNADEGIAAVAYEVDGGPTQQITDLNQTSVSLTGLSEGSHTVELHLVDNLGNQLSGDSVTFDVDTSPPVVTVTPARSSGIGANDPVAVDLTATDANYDSATFLVRDGGGTVVYSEDVTDELADGTATIDWDGTDDAGAPLATGDYDLVLTATDAVGQSSEANVTVGVDNTPPSVNTIAPNTTALGSGETLAVEVDADDSGAGGSGVDSVTVTLDYVSGSYRTTATATNNSGTWTARFDASNLARDGNYTVRVTATDGADNDGSTTGGTEVEVDTTAPSVSAIVKPKDDSTGYVNVTVSDDVPDASAIELDLTAPDGSDVTLDSSLSQVGSTNTYSGEFTYLGDGEYTLEVNATDEAGNLGETTANTTIESALSGDQFTIVGGDGTVVVLNMTGTVTGFAAFTVSGTPLAELGTNVGSTFLNGELGPTLTAKLDNATIYIPTDGNVPPGVNEDDVSISRYNETDGVWEPFPTHVETADPDGDGTDVKYFVTTVENFSTWGPVSPDNTAPSIDSTAVSPSDDPLPYSTSTVDVTVEYSDNKQVDATNVTVWFNGANVTDDTDTSISTSEATFTANDDLVGSGENNVTVVVEDTAGNQNVSTVLFTVEQDTAGPTVSMGQDTFAYGTDPVPLEFTYSDALSGVNTSTVSLTVEGTDVTGPAVVTSTGVQYDAAGRAPGTYQATLTVSDQEGNAQTFTGTFTVRDDTVAPTVSGATFTPSLSGGVLPAGTTQATVRLTYDDATSGIDTGAVVVTFDGQDVTDEAVITSGWLEYTAIDLENGTSHTLEATIVDREGNVRTETVTVEVGSPSASAGAFAGVPPFVGGQSDLEDEEPVGVSKMLSGGNASFVLDRGVSRLDVSFDDRGASGTVSVQTLDRLPEGVDRIPDASIVGLVDVTVPDSLRNAGATLRFTVSADAIGDASPSDLVVYHHRDGAWTALDTTVVSTDGGEIVLEAKTRGFSPFAVGVPAEAQQTTTTTTPEPTTSTTTTAEPTTTTAEPTTTTAGPTTGSPSTTEPIEEPGGFMSWVVLLVIVVAGLVVAVYYARTRRD